MMAVIRPSSKHIAGLLPNPNLCSMPTIADFKIFIPLLLCHSALKWGKIPSIQKYMWMCLRGIELRTKTVWDILRLLLIVVFFVFYSTRLFPGCLGYPLYHSLCTRSEYKQTKHCLVLLLEKYQKKSIPFWDMFWFE